MKAIIALTTLALLGCTGKLRATRDEKRLQAALGIPSAPSGASACTPTAPKTLEKNLQTKNPIPAAVLTSGKAYQVIWARAEAVDVPDEPNAIESPFSPPSAEIGSLQLVKVTNNPKATLDIERLTSERSGTSKLSFAQQGAVSSYFFEDEFGVHFAQRSGSKATGLAFDVVGGRSPSVLNTKSGLWMFWASTCDGGGEIKILKAAKDQTPEGARSQAADGILCGRANLATASNGNKVAVAWLVKGYTDQKGRVTDNQIAVMFGDAAQGTFDKPILLTPGPNTPDKNPIAGPALSFTPDGKELAISWLIEAKAVGFTTIDTTGKTIVAPSLLPGSYQAKDLAAVMVSDNTYHSLAWSDGKTVTLGVLARSGAMATALLSMGPGSRPTLAAGFAAKEYSLFYWQPSTSSSSKALVYQQASCFPPPPKKTKTKKPKKTTPPK